MQSFFHNTFRNVNTPVIVCGSGEQLPLVFVNARARVLLNPHYNTSLSMGEPINTLRQFLRFVIPGAFDDIVREVRTVGSVDHFHADVLDFEDGVIPVSISANLVSIADREHIVLYVNEEEERDLWSDKETAGVLHQVFHAAYHSDTLHDAIDRILRVAGSFARVSRAYLYEAVSPAMVRNTYSWCRDGAGPVLLTEFPTNDANYSTIVDAVVFACKDAEELKRRSYSLFSGEGVQALAVAGLYHLDTPMGFIGFDDCERQRNWNSQELEFLQNVADILASLLVRRNAEDKAMRTRKIMGIISDAMDNSVYVSSLDTMEIMFANKALADSLNTTQEEIIGKPCWQVLRPDLSGPCEWCPVPNMVKADGHVRRGNYQWEYQTPATGKWYLARDSIIEWVDGQTVHLHTATEITQQKLLELELERSAFTDALTGVYNREWGYKEMQKLKNLPRSARGDVSLCFIDLDGLKGTNDTLGHEAGDLRIKRTVEVISNSIRKMDILIRWGGDEFILLLKCGVEDAERVMNHIQQRLDENNQGQPLPYHLGFSYGITDFNEVDNGTIDEVMARADQKMYSHKMEKRGAVR